MAKHLKTTTVSRRLQDRGRPAGFKDWLASTACSFLCCLGCCRPDTPPDGDKSHDKPTDRKLSTAGASTAESNRSNRKITTHDESLKALAAAARGAKRDGIAVNA